LQLRRSIERRKLPVGKCETRECEPWRNGAADQRPITEAPGTLPVIFGHDHLRPLACREIGAEADAGDRPSGRRQLELQRRSRVVMPALCGIDGMPVRLLAGFQQELDGRRSRTSACLDIVAECLAEMTALGMRRQFQKRDDVVGGKIARHALPR
jgi:hypothetical protein